MIHPRQRHTPSRRCALRSLAVTAAGLLFRLPRAQSHPRPAKWDDRMEVAVEFEIIQGSEFRWRRPYVAVWVEDRSGKYIRTLSLWVQTSRKGPRWIPDLRKWYRFAQDQLQAGGPDLVATVSSATRTAGKYTLVWNGRDDKDKPVEQGVYNICIEAAREHGTYQLMRKEINCGGKEAKAEIEGNVEIRGAVLEYRKRR